MRYRFKALGSIYLNIDCQEFLERLLKEPAVLKHIDKEYEISLEGIPPCDAACPAGIKVKSYVNLIANKRYLEALSIIMQDNPFPGICGYVCPHPCEDECTRSDLDMAVKIRELKRWAAEYEMSRRPLAIEPYPVKYDEKVAVIGAGPSGLVTALDLTKMGYSVTVYEKEKKAGGTMRYGIPEYRLPERMLNFELSYLKKVGISIRTGRKVSSVHDLFQQGYKAVIMALGTLKGNKLNIPGADLPGVWDALNFLKMCNQGPPPEVKGTVVVIGGGNSAMDAARSAKRLGAGEVIIAYRRSRGEMPAYEEEIEEAVAEGIDIKFLSIPFKIIGDSEVKGIEMLEAELREPDRSGRRRPIPKEGSNLFIDASMIIIAVGMHPELDDFQGEIEIRKNGLIKVTESNETSAPMVFAAGDVVTGPSSVVKAIETAHNTALAIHKIFHKEDANRSCPPMPVIKTKPVSTDNLVDCRPEERYNTSIMNKESSKCLSCGSCFECDICLSSCDYKVILGQVDDNRFLMKVPTDFKVNSPGNGRLRTKEGIFDIQMYSLTPTVNVERCIGCGRCEDSCVYNAITVRHYKSKPQHAEVDTDICRVCGACTGACPTGAIQQGPLSDLSLLSEAGGIVSRTNGPVQISSIWDKGSACFENDFVGVTGLRRIGPSLLVQILGKGAPSIQFDSEHISHYLSNDNDIDELISRTNELLRLVGADKDLVGKDSSSQGDREFEVSVVQKEENSPLFNGLSILKETYKSNLGELAMDKSVQLENAYFTAEGLPVLNEMAEAVSELGEVTDLESFLIINKTKLMNTDFQGLKIALDCDGEPLVDFFNGLKNLEVVYKVPKCNRFKWERPGPNDRTEALDILKAARAADAEMFITTSPDNHSFISTITRKEAWRRTNIKVIDIFSFIRNSQRNMEVQQRE